jgi:hypothetical protein
MNNIQYCRNYHWYIVSVIFSTILVNYSCVQKTCITLQITTLMLKPDTPHIRVIAWYDNVLWWYTCTLISFVGFLIFKNSIINISTDRICSTVIHMAPSNIQVSCYTCYSWFGRVALEGIDRYYVINNLDSNMCYAHSYEVPKRKPLHALAQSNHNVFLMIYHQKHKNETLNVIHVTNIYEWELQLPSRLNWECDRTRPNVRTYKLKAFHKRIKNMKPSC